MNYSHERSMLNNKKADRLFVINNDGFSTIYKISGNCKFENYWKFQKKKKKKCYERKLSGK